MLELIDKVDLIKNSIKGHISPPAPPARAPAPPARAPAPPAPPARAPDPPHAPAVLHPIPLFSYSRSQILRRAALFTGILHEILHFSKKNTF